MSKQLMSFPNWAIRHLTIGATSPRSWVPVLESALGLELQSDRDWQEAPLAFLIDSNHRIAVVQAPTDGLIGIGLEAVSKEHLERVIGLLDVGSLSLRDDEWFETIYGTGSTGYRVVDPAGTCLDLFIQERHSREGVVFGSYVTGEQGLGHVARMVSDRERTTDFYRDMGFRSSDQTHIGDVVIDFLRCNSRHHSIAIGSDTGPPRLLHFALELPDTDSVIECMERCMLHNVQITESLGRHTNDRMVSFYAAAPGGVDIEVGASGLRLSNDDRSVTTSYTTNDWGHQHLAERGARIAL